MNNSGSTTQLVEYFQRHEERKDEHERLQVKNILITSNTSTTTPSKTASATSRKRKKAQTIAYSFIDTLLQEDVATESMDKDFNTVIKSKTIAGSRSRGGGKDDEEENKILLPISELEHIPHEHLIGKPVRLYCPNVNMYHNGRILDTRRDEESIVALVRFASGKDRRMSTFIQWIYLEEHCIAVASDLVWAWMADTNNHPSTSPKKKGGGSGGGDGAHWTRGRLWRRSARELVPVIDQLQEEEDQIRFRLLKEDGSATMDGSQNTTIDSSTTIATTDDDDGKIEQIPSDSQVPSTPSSPKWGLVESFVGTYELLNLNDETKPEPLASGPKVNDPILSGLVQVELEEQRRIQWWRGLPLRDPSLTLQAQNPPSLEFEMPVEKEYIRPSSLVDLGLDREMMVRLVSQQLSIEPTKDLGLRLSCETVDCLTSIMHPL